MTNQKRMSNIIALGKRRKKVSDVNNVYGYLFISPFIIGFVVFTAISFGTAIYISFTRYNIISPPEWIGFQNYYNMLFNDARFWQSFWNTMIYVGVSVPARLVLALAVAMVMMRAGKMSSFYRMVYYLPTVMGGSIAVMLMWRRIMSSDGALNSFLQSLGIDATISWVFDPRTAMGTLILLALWQIGASMLIFLAGLKQIPSSYYEAAVIDGANGWQKFSKITLPLLTPVIFFNLIMGIINSFQAFTQSFVVTEGRPMGMTRLFAMNLFENAFQFGQMGYASAMAWFMFFVIAFFTMFVFKSSGGWVFYESENG